MRLLGALAALLTAIAAAWQYAEVLAPLPAVPTVSKVVTDADGLPLRAFPVDEGRWRLAADLDKVDPRFIEALLLIEDKRFFEHRGVDGLAVARALRDNLVRGQIVSGASTITMQTVRLLEQRPRTLPSKLIEALRARQLERVLTKAEILELYLTLTPYGGNVEGLRSAAWTYFGKDARELTDAEIALLVALPQSPEARRPDRRPEAAFAARREILQRLAADGVVPPSRAEEAAADPLPSVRRPFPSEAWHFTEAVRSPTDRFGVLRTTLHRSAQKALETALTSAAEGRGPVTQAAGIVIDLETRTVLASVGSVDRSRPGGWIDLTRRKRSPGSTLKPLVYGMAFQEGIVSPRSMISDLPSRFGAYEPENFDRMFNGDLTVAEALQHSLNVPAVLLLDALGTERFAGNLRLAGMDVMIPEAAGTSEGLATVLGGLGLSVREIAMLYAALGNGGLAAPLSDVPREELLQSYRILSEEAAANITTILRQAPSSEGRLPSHLAAHAPQVAFKTGTSYGFRDAWAAGYSDRHAAVVWVGRADGAASPGMTGRNTALPALLSVFDALEPVRDEYAPSTAAREPSKRKLAASEGPTLLFPADGATLWPKADGSAFYFAARGQNVRWYVDGRPLPEDEDGNVAWQPNGPGFYSVHVVDDEGRSDHAQFRLARVDS